MQNIHICRYRYRYRWQTSSSKHRTLVCFLLARRRPDNVSPKPDFLRSSSFASMPPGLLVKLGQGDFREPRARPIEKWCKKFHADASQKISQLYIGRPPSSNRERSSASNLRGERENPSSIEASGQRENETWLGCTADSMRTSS